MIEIQLGVKEKFQMVQKLKITQDDFQKVVDFIVPLKKNGDLQNGYCPFCSNTDEPRFIYKANKTEWRCYECKSYGNVIDLVQQYYKASEQEAKDIIKTTLASLYRNREEKTSNSADVSILQKDNGTQVYSELKTTDISEEDGFSSLLIDEMTGLVMTLRSINGYLGMVLSLGDYNVCSKIPEGMDEKTVTAAFKFKDSVKSNLHKAWKEYSIDPIEILMAGDGDDIKILLVQSSVEKQSSFNLCLFVDKNSASSMFQLQIRNFLMRIKTKDV